MTTGPTKEKPSFFICLDIFCDRSLEVGTSSKLAISCTIGVGTKFCKYLATEQYFCSIAKNARAFLTAALIFIRLRIMPLFCINESISLSVIFATSEICQFLNAALKLSRLCKTVDQLKPDWKSSSTSISYKCDSSRLSLHHS